MRESLNNKGFTLLELLIALVVLAFGLMGVSGMIITSVKGNAFGGRMTQATALAQNKIEEMRNEPYANLYVGCNVGGYPQFCANAPGAMSGASQLPNDSGNNGDELTGGSGDALWTYKYNDAAKPLPAGMTLVWGVKRNYPQPGMIWLMACTVWGGQGEAGECNKTTHTNKNIHVVRVESVMGNF